ncbi:acyltransferase [Propioniciclava coleopterorum]|uniref:Acyltransferase n=1 Tax=Propioniciclava coleopterorum TaxID=2714937 RepID=A0A6G7Y8X4_9ACTN|nr:acyltransferase [Propioniciclava coleopterorum]QIK73067.1 acyltransferase [Propioniciclava coleopterorum]
MHTTTATVPPRTQRRFMPEIQGLRAVAVGLVVLFHLWPTQMPGGFVGVDVFFVISGYLITSHLLRELDRTGSIRLGSFYARRARRLLPASLLVLAVSGVAAAVILPAQLARASLREVIAGTFYVENLFLASKAVTYSASNDTASPVQHYWSLSTEEQFYALWPALILFAVWVAARAARRAGGTHSPRAAAAVALGLLAAASLIHSIVLTDADPAAAYFVTTTRAWEFGIGALTSFVALRWTPRGPVAATMRWAGFAAIVATSFLISQATPFPGRWLCGPSWGPPGSSWPVTRSPPTRSSASGTCARCSGSATSRMRSTCGTGP